MITIGCQYYDHLGAAFIEKTDEPMKPIKTLENGRFVAVYTGKAQCDYKGTLRGGRAVAFEAKNAENDQIKQAAVKKHQADWLDKQAKYGALCFVAVGIRCQKYYRVPWHVWGKMKEIYGRKYMTLQDLAPYEVPTILHNMQIGIQILRGLA